MVASVLVWQIARKEADGGVTLPAWEHSSVVEQRADNAEVDSSHLSVPIAFGQITLLAQRIRASDYGSEGRRFESYGECHGRLAEWLKAGVC